MKEKQYQDLVEQMTSDVPEHVAESLRMAEVCMWKPDTQKPSMVRRATAMVSSVLLLFGVMACVLGERIGEMWLFEWGLTGCGIGAAAMGFDYAHAGRKCIRDKDAGMKALRLMGWGGFFLLFGILACLAGSAQMLGFSTALLQNNPAVTAGLVSLLGTGLILFDIPRLLGIREDAACLRMALESVPRRLFGFTAFLAGLGVLMYALQLFWELSGA
jgi:hypothetical protein